MYISLELVHKLNFKKTFFLLLHSFLFHIPTHFLPCQSVIVDASPFLMLFVPSFRIPANIFLSDFLNKTTSFYKG